MTRMMRTGLFGLGLTCLLVWCGIRIYMAERFNQDIGGHIERAAHSHSLVVAADELGVALNNIDQWGICPKAVGVAEVLGLPANCYTSVAWRTRDEDAAFWRFNLMGAYQNLVSLRGTDPLTASNELVKLQGTLLYRGKREMVVAPSGISVYRHNIALAWFGWVALVISLLGLILKANEDW